jgi:hypothetical protein
MSAITRDSTKNYGGIRRLRYAIQADVAALLGIKSLELSNAKTLSISQSDFDTNFFGLDFMPRTANHDFKTQPSAHGNAYDHEIEAVFHKDRQEIRNQLAKSAFRKLVMAWQDQNGTWKVAWGWDQTESFGTGKEPKDPNEYLMNWRANLTYDPLILTITVE